MALDIARVRKAALNIAKFLRKNTKRPSSKAIHNFRTNIRILETTFEGTNKKVLRDLAGLRHRAGNVRDMDVLTAKALTVSVKAVKGEQDCLVQLLEYLGSERSRYTRKLRRSIEDAGPQLRHRVARAAKQADGAAAPAPRTLNLQQPARLGRGNLHEYRIQVKELRDVLQLSSQGKDNKLITRLGIVKDAIGEWHDWEELLTIAAQSLDHGKSCRLIKHVKATADSKFKHALSTATSLRTSLAD